MIAFLDWLPIILSIIGVIGVGGVLMLLGLWPVVSSFLIGTKSGRMVSLAGAAVLAVFWAFVAGRRSGSKRVRTRQKADNYKAAKDRVKSDDKIRKMPVADRRRELDRWVRE